MKNENSNPSDDPLFDLPDFEIPQRESPCAAKWSYDEAMRAFEEIAIQMRLQDPVPTKQDIPLFEM